VPEVLVQQAARWQLEPALARGLLTEQVPYA
jgi:hypothetical protein